MIGKENLVPTQTEIDKHKRKVDECWGKAKVAATTGIVLVGASLVFPPVIAGAAVAAGEVGRQVIKMDLEVIRYHSKFPGLG